MDAVGRVGDKRRGATAGAARLHEAARQFEAMFMTEMLRLTRPPAKAAGVFAVGTGEKSWQILMDQALGQAAAGGETGLATEIEAALRAAQARQGRGSGA